MTDLAVSPDAAFDPSDPHGFHSHDTHGHVVLSPKTLVGVLVALLVFTALTVFASRFEVWMAGAFDMEIPQWVNVSIAMSIAVMKALLVLMFFMQLKYDAPLNSMIFATCLVAFATFLGFTAIDLFGRGTVDRVRAGEIQSGGLGATHSRTEQVFNEETGAWESKRVGLAGVAVADRARTRERGPDEQRVTNHHEDPPELSTANRSVPLIGLHLFAEPGAHATTHSDEGHTEGVPADAEDHAAGEPESESDG